MTADIGSCSAGMYKLSLDDDDDGTIELSWKIFDEDDLKYFFWFISYSVPHIGNISFVAMIFVDMLVVAAVVVVYISFMIVLFNSISLDNDFAVNMFGIDKTWIKFDVRKRSFMIDR